jgi:hypothetical protein
MSISEIIITENNLTELIKDAVNLYEDCGGTLEDAFAFASTLHGCNRKFSKRIQRTMHNLRRKKYPINN